MTQHLVISALGPDRAGLVDALTQAVSDHGGNIGESRMAVLGGEFAMIMLVSGDAAAIDAIEQDLPALQTRLGMTLLHKRTSRRGLDPVRMPYDVEVVSMDHPGIVHEVADFFARRGINIERLDTENYAAPLSGVTMFSLTMTIGLPREISASKLRHEFIEFCEDLNLDATLQAGR